MYAVMRSNGVVFLGEVVEITHRKWSALVRFDVEECWRGHVSEADTVSTKAISSACGYPFKIGERYVVFARHLADHHYRTDACTRTTTADRAQQLIHDMRDFLLEPHPAGIAEISQWITYTFADGPLQFRYPELLEITEYGGVVTIQHSVPYEHEWTFHGSESVYKSNRFVDFRMKLWFEDQEQADLPLRDYEELHPVNFGYRSGYRESTGAHCGGQHTYYFPARGGHIVAERPLCYAWEDCDPECIEELRAIPGVITEETGDRLFDWIIRGVEMPGPTTDE